MEGIPNNVSMLYISWILITLAVKNFVPRCSTITPFLRWKKSVRKEVTSQVWYNKLHICKGHHLHYSLWVALPGTVLPWSPQFSELLPLSRTPSRNNSLGTVSILSLCLSIAWGLNTPCSRHRKPWEGSAPASRCYHSPGSGPWTVYTNLAGS